jgi:hypothetical protein
LEATELGLADEEELVEVQKRIDAHQTTQMP